SARPDLLGGVRVWLDVGKYVEAAYFTSEAEARKNEASAEFAGPQSEYGALFGEMTFTDLRDPLLDTAERCGAARRSSTACVGSCVDAAERACERSNRYGSKR